MLRISLKIACLLSLLTLHGCSGQPPATGLLGPYRLDDGRIVSIRRSVDDTLRYREFDSGRSGRLFPEGDGQYVSGDGFSNREPVELTIHLQAGGSDSSRKLNWQQSGRTGQTGIRIGRARDLWFESDGVRLYGRLQTPEGDPPYPAVVLVHGSGSQTATEWFYNGDFFVARGIAALTYDKRGSGRSGGDFTFDFHQLARDASAAVSHLSSAADIDSTRIGLSGYSQGGWVAPLAAQLNPEISFVIVNYGMIESPAEEARLEMHHLLVTNGVEGDDLADADELIDAAVEVVADGLKGDWSEFQRLKQKHGDAPWTKYLDGTPVGRLLDYPKWLSQAAGVFLLPDGLDWHYDSTELLNESRTPMTWLLAAEDLSAPNEQTIAKLESLISQGMPYQLRVFPGTDHGMLEFDTVDGDREYTGYAAEYFEAEVAAAKDYLRNR